MAMLHFQGVGWDRNHTPFLTFGVPVLLLFAWHTTRMIVVYLWAVQVEGEMSVVLVVLCWLVRLGDNVESFVECGYFYNCLVRLVKK